MSVMNYGNRMNKWKWEVENYDFLEGIDHLKELNYHDKKSIHNLKYFTWVEQQGKGR